MIKEIDQETATLVMKEGTQIYYRGRKDGYSPTNWTAFHTYTGTLTSVPTDYKTFIFGVEVE